MVTHAQFIQFSISLCMNSKKYCDNTTWSLCVFDNVRHKKYEYITCLSLFLKILIMYLHEAHCHYLSYKIFWNLIGLFPFSFDICLFCSLANEVNKQLWWLFIQSYIFCCSPAILVVVLPLNEDFVYNMHLTLKYLCYTDSSIIMLNGIFMYINADLHCILCNVKCSHRRFAS